MTPSTPSPRVRPRVLARAGAVLASVAIGLTGLVGATSAQAVTTGQPQLVQPQLAAATKVAPKQRVKVTGIVDGDTIKVRVGTKTETVRIIGLNTPERGQCYYQQASSKMQSLAQSRYVRIERDYSQTNRDKYGRLLRHVHLTDGRVAAKVMIEQGFGREYTYAKAYRYRNGFIKAQKSAQSKRLRMWSACAKPVTVKKPTTQTTSSCKIKGNISSSGEKIYHVPGQRHYSITVITPSKGERWFCTETQARNAGWRKSKV